MPIINVDGDTYPVITRQNFLEPFVILLREGNEADPYVEINETIKMVSVVEFNANMRAIAVLRETPLEIQGVIAKVGDKELIEIRDSLNQIDEDHFKVDYTNGRVYLDLAYKDVKVEFSYKGRGAIFVTSDRVLLNNGREGNYVYTLSKFVQEQLSEMNVGDLNDLLTQNKEKVVFAINEVWQMITDHEARRDNPHEVTKAQVGLGNVDNTADMDKPVSIPQKTYIDAADQALDDKIVTHIEDLTNPHKVTKVQVGLGNVDNTSDINKPVSTAQKAYIDEGDAKLQAQISALEGVFIYIGRINLDTDDVTQEALTARAQEIMGTAELQNGWVLLDNENHEWYYNASMDEWIDFETANIYPATNDTLGIVKGNDYISITEGIMTVLKSQDSAKLGGQEAIYYAPQSDVDLKAYIEDVLTKTNTEPYTPISSYNPATKKYVDDKFQGSTQWGTIEGELDNQADLVNALLNKQDKETAWNTENMIPDTEQPPAPATGYILWVDTNE